MDEASTRPCQLVALSAGTPDELDRITVRLADDLALRPSTSLAEVASDPRLWRPEAPYRRAFVARDATEAVRLLRRAVPVTEPVTGGRPVVFLFPGVGDHYAGMGRGLYRSEPVFRHWLDHCAERLTGELGLDLRAVLYADGTEPAAGGHASGIDLAKLLGRRDEAVAEIDRTRLAQPLVFAVEYALARLLLSWGITPSGLAGYSIGEYVAAAVAEVLPLDDALILVARRAGLIETAPAGAMLVVMLGEEELADLLDEELSLAAVDGPELCVAAGPVHAVERLEKRLTADGVSHLRAGTRHAFHSAMLTPIRAPLAELAGRFRLGPPRIPFLSNVSGTWITGAQAASPGYWAGHVDHTVRFHDNLTAMWRRPSVVALEVGAGQMLCGLAAQHPDRPPGTPPVFATLPGATAGGGDTAALLSTAGRLWCAGVPVDLAALWPRERR
ncbi:acyltransferase domain-containing protein [Amycolatopsis sp. NPDC005003]